MKPCVILEILSVVAGMKTAEPSRRTFQLFRHRTLRGSSWVRLGGRIRMCILLPLPRGGALAGHFLQYQLKCGRGARRTQSAREEDDARLTIMSCSGLEVGLDVANVLHVEQGEHLGDDSDIRERERARPICRMSETSCRLGWRETFERIPTSTAEKSSCMSETSYRFRRPGT